MEKKQKAVITVTTDFGTRDPYLGMMHGVMLEINPEVQLVGLCHSVPAFSVMEAAFALNFGYRFFPPGSIHLVVVDPGVGTERKPLLVTSPNYHFIAPDNGVLSFIYANEKEHQVREISNPRYFRHPVSDTFHGRDIFGPAAAWLSRGVAPQEFGSLLTEYERFEVPQPSFAQGVVSGQIMYIDRFGNLITNIGRRFLEECREKAGEEFYLQVGDLRIDKLVRSYRYLEDPGGPFMLFGGTSYLEIAICQRRADEVLGFGVGEKVRLVFGQLLEIQ